MSASAVEVRDAGPGIVQITMQDRQGKNTFTPQFVHGLLAAFEQVASSATCKVVVLTGYESYFATGGTLEGLLELHEGRGKFTDTKIYSLALDCRVPVIAAMQGHGIGGGFVFGLFADCVILSRESVYSTNFMKYGFTPGMGSTLILPKKLGPALAHEMLLSAASYRGADLEKRGVPYEVLPRGDVLPRAHELAREIADKPRTSLLTLKAHLVAEIRAELGACIDKEVAMHAITFHQPEVKERIKTLFGK